MTPTQVMEAEHRLIESVVRALGGAAVGIEQGQPADAAMLTTAVEFLRVYADQLHHGKEETLFFPMLVKRGLAPQGCPIGVLNYDHEKGRALVRSLAEQVRAHAEGRPEVKERLLETLRGILDLYQTHIRKEDSILFPVADRILIAADQAELSSKFSEVDRAIGFETIARLETFAQSLATRVQPPLPNAARPLCWDCECGS